MTILDFLSAPQKWEARIPEGEDGAGLTLLSADVVLSEAYSFGAEVTFHPVEEGADIVDHKRLRPIGLRMSGVVSDSPNDFADVLKGQQVVKIDVQTLSQTIEADKRRSQEAYQRLIRLYQQEMPFDVVTSRAVYHNQIVQNLQIHKNDAGEYIGFELECIEIRFVQTNSVQVMEKAQADVHPTAAPKKAALTRPKPLANKSIFRVQINFAKKVYDKLVK